VSESGEEESETEGEGLSSSDDSGGDSDESEKAPKKKKGNKAAGVGSDIAALGSFTGRKSVVKQGLGVIVQRLQQSAAAGGFASYAEYEAAMTRLSAQVNVAVSRKFSKGSEKGRKMADELLKVNREIVTIMERTEMCKSVVPSRRSWDTQRRFVLNENGWNEGGQGPTTKQFQDVCKRYNMIDKLYGGSGSLGSRIDDAEEDLFSGGRSRGRGRDRDRRQRGDDDGSSMKCRNCGKFGHGSWQCPKKKDLSKVKCHRCQEMGHMAKDCQNERKEE
jgi:hypothetical protein